MDTGQEFIRGLIAILAIVNPIGAITVFLGTTSDQSRDQQVRTARTAAITMGVTLIAATWIGETLLRMFGIGVPAFRAGGGILFLLMAISMLKARPEESKQSRDELEEAADREGIGVVPLGIPLLAGPGAIALVIVEAHQSPDWVSATLTTASVLIAAGVSWISLRLATGIGALLGQTGINIITRLMGLILAAIGVEFIAGGAIVLFPGLG